MGHADGGPRPNFGGDGVGVAAHRVRGVGALCPPEPHADAGRQRRGRTAGRGGGFRDDRDPRRVRVRRRRARVVAVGQRPCPTQRRSRSPADDDRERILDRQGSEREVLDRVETAAERVRRAGPEVAPQPDRLVEIRPADMEPVGHREVLELGLVPADADARGHPPPAQRIERRELLGQEHGVALRDDDDAGPQAHPRVARTDPGEGQDRLVDPAVVRRGILRNEDVVGRPDGGHPELFGDLGRGVDPLGRGTRREVRQAEAVVHARMVAALVRGRGEREDTVREPRPGLERPRPVLAIGQHDERQVCDRVDPGERPGPTEVPECRRAVGVGHPVGRLPVVELEAESPVERIEPPDPWQQADQPRERDRRGGHERHARDQGGPQQFRGECHGVRQRTVQALRRPSEERRPGHPERREDGLAHHRRERPSGPRLDERSERIEPSVRVDPARPGRRERHRAFERQSRRVRQEMPDGRAARPGLVAEPDDAAVGGDQHGQRSRHLGDRRPAEDVPRVAPRRDGAARPDDGRRRVSRVP